MQLNLRAFICETSAKQRIQAPENGSSLSTHVNSPTKRSLYIWGGQLGVSLIVIAVLFAFAPLEDWKRVFTTVNLVWLGLGVSFVCLLGLLDAMRLENLLPPLKPKRLTNLRLVFMGSCFAQLPLGIIGGEIYRSAALKALGIKLTTAISAILICRWVGLFSTLLIGGVAAIGLIIFPNVITTNDTQQALRLLGGGLLLICAAPVSLWFLGKISDRVSRAIQHVVTTFHNTPTKTLLGIFGLSLLMAGLRVAILMVCLFAVGTSLNIFVVMLSLSFGFVLTIIPISSAGIGIREGGMAAIMNWAGIALPEAIIIAILFRIIIILGSISGLVLSLLALTIKKPNHGES